MSKRCGVSCDQPSLTNLCYAENGVQLARYGVIIYRPTYVIHFSCYPFD